MLIIFDLDDTLIDTSGCITPLQLEKAVAALIKEGAPIQDLKQASLLLKRLDSSSMSAKHALEEFLEISDIDKKFLDLAIKEVYETFPEDATIYPLDLAVEMLQELCLQHRLALVTIGSKELQYYKMKKAGIDSTIFSKIIVTKHKNKKECYQTMLEEFSMPVHEVIVCGDRIETDLTPAKELGLTTVHMRWGRGLGSTGMKSDVDFTISHLAQMRDVLIKISNLSSINGK